MIKSFRHKGLERFFRKSDARGVQAQHLSRIQRILTLLDEASAPGQLDVLGMFLHPLKGPRKGDWSMIVSGNWRITFRFAAEDVIIVDLEDYH